MVQLEARGWSAATVTGFSAAAATVHGERASNGVCDVESSLLGLQIIMGA